MKVVKTIQYLFFIISIITISYAATPTPQMPPAAVNVVTAKLAEWQPTIYSTGTLVPDKGVVIKSDISGRITKIYFRSGTFVKIGQSLVQIFPYVLQAQLKEDQANLNLKQLTFQRFAELYKKNAASKSQYDEAAANYQVALATVEQTQAQLDQTLIKAPFNGYLGIRQVNVGGYLAAGDTIINLEDTDPMFVDFSVPEVYSKQIQKHQRVEVSSTAYGKQIFNGKIVAMESLIDPNTRTLKIRARLPNKDNMLIPGSFVITKVFIGQAKQLIELPQTAIVYSEQGNYVYVVKNNKAVKTVVELGERSDKNIFITSGLAIGDTVVIEGQQRLFDGANVDIEKP